MRFWILDGEGGEVRVYEVTPRQVSAYLRCCRIQVMNRCRNAMLRHGVNGGPPVECTVTLIVACVEKDRSVISS